MKTNSLEKLLQIMAKLRSPEGCPWDLEQDHRSLRPYLLEEAYEVLNAIDKGDNETLKNELGDLLLQIVFHSQIAAEKGEFDFEQVAEAIANKLILRHPHVFGETKVENSQEVLRNWEAIKIQSEKRSLLSGIPDHLPALLAAYRVQEKAAGIGFDWKDISGIKDKLKEEWREFHQAVETADASKMEEEFGDLLFILVNYGKWQGINAELALKRTVKKFIERFNYIEKKLEENGSSPDKSSLEEMDLYWEEAKNKIRN